MARGTQFLSLVTQLRDELRRSNSVAVGVDDLSSLKQVLNRVYETLYDEWDWPHLRVAFTPITLAAGQRYYDLPTSPIALDYERVERVHVWYSGIPHEIERGIAIDDYASYDSTADVRAEPALKWDVRFTGTAEQIEIWPIPASNSQTLQFTGTRAFDRLVADADLCRLDDTLVVLFAAAQLLKSQKAQDADLVLAAARDRLATVKGRSGSGGQKIYQMGLGNGSSPERSRAIVRVR